ncbi:MAG: HAMP domain-containing protein [Deltaproteobacteria bacterium]|nr:HAMP domain-containing protein [Deltaproteobacteria bacterium]
MKLTTTGIRAQLISGIVVTTLAAIGFVGALSVLLLQTNALTLKVGEAVKVANILRVTVLDVKNPSGIEGYARGVMRASGISAMVIRDRDGNAVFSEGDLPAEKGESVFFENGVKIHRLGHGRPSWTAGWPSWTTDWFGGPGRLLRVTVAEGTGGAEALRAEFTVSLSDIALYSSTMRRVIVFYAVVDSVIIMALGIYFLSRFIIRPVKRLETAATRISGGDLGVRAEVVGNDEIGRLASAFNSMAERLQLEIERLGRVNGELMDTQEELLRTQTLASVGRLAAGIAHEIGNPLGAVSGYLGVLAKGLCDRAEEKDIIERTVREISRIDRIVKEFLYISRPPKAPAHAADVNAIVKETSALLSCDAAFKGVTTELKLQDNLPPVNMDGDRLRQVLLNLLINAAEATGARGGVVTVETSAVSRPVAVKTPVRVRKDDPGPLPAVMDNRQGRLAGRAERRSVAVSVADGGRGVKKEDMEKIFDPFYTTKPPGLGTGLGLFMSQTIVKACGGTIEVESAPGEGSVFRVLIPEMPGEA